MKELLSYEDIQRATEAMKTIAELSGADPHKDRLLLIMNRGTVRTAVLTQGGSWGGALAELTWRCQHQPKEHVVD